MKTISSFPASDIRQIWSDSVYTSGRSNLPGIGDEIETLDGRGFKFVKLDSSFARTRGRIVLGRVPTVINTANTTAILGNSDSVTIGGTSVTSNEFAGGFLHITGVGLFRIVKHTASTNGNATFTLAEPIHEAVPSTWSGYLVPKDGDGTGSAGAKPLGVLLADVVATEETKYLWVQTSGIGMVYMVEALPAGMIPLSRGASFGFDVRDALDDQTIAHCWTEGTSEVGYHRAVINM